jgi:hypothetical protein
MWSKRSFSSAKSCCRCSRKHLPVHCASRSPSFDHFVGGSEQRWWHGKAERGACKPEPQCCLRKVASTSVNCSDFATSKLLIAFRFPLDANANLAFVAPISPTKTELDMCGSACRKRDISGRRRVVVPDCQSKLMVTIGTSKDTDLGIVARRRYDIDQAHFGATAATR